MKKISLLFIIGFISNLAFAQDDDWKTLFSKTSQLFSDGNYKAGLDCAVKAKEIAYIEFGNEHINYTKSCSNLGLLYQYNNNFKNAELNFKEAKSIQERIVGKENADYATSCKLLAALYSEKGNYQLSEQLYLEALAIQEKLFGKENAAYAQTSNFLAVLYETIGKYALAEQLYIQAKDIREKLFGKDNLAYSASCMSLANFYINLSNYSKAEQLISEALKTDGKLLGYNHPDYISDISSLVNLYIITKRYYQAETILIELEKLIIQSSGNESIDYAHICELHAKINIHNGDFDSAEQYYLKGKSIFIKLYGAEHIYSIRSQYNLAGLYLAKGDNIKAEKFFSESKFRIEKLFGNQHPSYAACCIGLANVYINTMNFKKAYPYIKQTFENINNQFLYNSGFMSEKEKELFLKENSDYFNYFHSFALRYKDSNPEFLGLNYDNELLFKGKVLQSTMQMQKDILYSNNPDLISKYNELVELKKTLTFQNSLPKNKVTLDKDSLEQLINLVEKYLEREIQKNQGNKKTQTQTKRVNWQEVKQVLKPGEAAIEFISFRLRGRQNWTDSVLYCALVLQKDFKYPKMIFLCNENDLKSIIPTETGNSGQIDNIYNINGSYIDGSSGYFLYQKIWQPIDSVLKGIKKVFISPTGWLQKVSFNAIASPDKLFLSDKYLIETISSTAMITQKTQEFKADSLFRSVIYGGIKYTISIDEMKKQSAKYVINEDKIFVANRIINPNASLRGNLWSYLPGTLTEVLAIHTLFNMKGILFSGASANEESFKRLSGLNSPDIIHVATHGFTFPNPDDNYFDDELYESGDFQVSENPLLRTGLLFAGANNTWERDTLPVSVEDGILTAQEISDMYLPNTKLVVMSACETGLGEIQGREGVYGLQRAFKMSGVRYILMSLWQVPDQQTSELMQSFYKNLMEGISFREAFSMAQNKLKEQYRENPFQWGAFVLIE